jgi:arylsulfatase A-like enzyme
MAPVALTVVFMTAALLLVAGARLLRRDIPLELALTVFAFLALAGPAVASGRLHKLAMLLVALGIAVQSARLLAPRVRRAIPGMRRLAVGLGVVVLLLAGQVFGRQAWAEHRGAAALPPARLDSPNVLLVVLDTVRASSLSLYGYERPTTPVLDRFAAGGAVFEHAWATSPWTLPSHASIFTGRFAHELSADLVTPLDETFPTLAEHFRDRGYLTAGFAANLIYTTAEVGVARGFIHYDDYPVSAPMVANSSWLSRTLAGRLRDGLGRDQKMVRRSGASMTDRFLRWVGRPRERPFFAFINYFDAHAPYIPPAELAGRFGPERTGRAMHDLSNREHWTAEEVAIERDAYDAVLVGLDRQIGRLLDGLRQQGALDNTVVLITSDHGEQFGEHDLMDHGNSLYRSVLEVPLVVWYPPRVPAGLRIDTPVSLRDTAITLSDLAGATPSPFPGTSLASLWSDAVGVPSAVLSEVREGIRTAPWLPLARGPMKSLVADEHQYIQNGDGAEELYRLSDRAESTNLQLTPAAAGLLERLREAIGRLTRVAGPDPRENR